MSSQQATAVAEQRGLVEEEAAAQVGSVQALEMWWMSEQGEVGMVEIGQSKQSVEQGGKVEE